MKCHPDGSVAQRRDLLFTIHGIESEWKHYASLCHPDRSVAKWRDLQFTIHGIESEWKHYAPLCHPDRSVAKWRDLQFNGSVLEMFSASHPAG
jgi:hypothetical protein